MSRKRRRHRAEYKFKAALEAAKDEKTLSRLAEQDHLHPGQISEWKRQLLERGTSLCQSNQAQKQVEQVTHEAELYERIGCLEMELSLILPLSWSNTWGSP